MNNRSAMRMHIGLLQGAGLGALLLATAPAMAQTEPQNGQSAGQGGFGDIVVTARRREERLIDVPVAASALDTQALDRYNSTDLTTAAQNIPGVSLLRFSGASNGAAFSIRGVGNLAFDFGNESPVATAIDGVMVTRGRIASSAMFDVQRFEVFKGPQALFFGKNSPAGVVSITSQSPGTEFGGYLKTGYEFRTRNPQVEGAIDIPLSDALAMRVAGRWSNMYGGYIHNDARAIVDPFDIDPATGQNMMLPGAAHKEGPGTNTKVGRVTLVYRPVGAFDATLKVLASRERDNGGGLPLEVVSCGAPPSPATYGVPDPFSECKGNYHTSNGNVPKQIADNFLYYDTPFSQTDNVISSLTMNYDTGPVTLTSVTGYYHSKFSSFDNFDNTVWAQAIAAQREKNDQFTQELRAVSNFDGPLNFTAGAFYQHERRNFLNTSKVAPLGPISAAIAPLVVAPDVDASQYIGKYNNYTVSAQNRGRVISFFGQARLKITSNLELTGGARWTDERKNTRIGLDLNTLNLAFGPIYSPPGYRYNPETESKNVSPEMTLTWKPTTDITTYAAYKTGFLAAGIQNPAILANYHGACQLTQPADVIGCENAKLTYKPQKASGFEGGIKGYLMDRRMFFDLSVYRYKFTNLQVTNFDPTTISFDIRNAGASRSQGVELQLQYKAMRNLQLRGSVAYTDLKFTDYSSAPCYQMQPVLPFAPVAQRQQYSCYAIAPGATTGEQFLSGTRYGRSPLQTNLGATYTQDLHIGWSLETSLDWYYYSKEPLPRITYASRAPAHSLFNASLRLTSNDDKWEMALIGTNLANKTWYVTPVSEKPLGTFTPSSGDLPTFLQPPRQVTFQITRRF